MNAHLSLSSFSRVTACWQVLMTLSVLLGAACVQAQFRPGLGAGNALTLANGGHVVVTTPPALSNAFTFEAWIYVPDTNGYYTLISRGPGNLVTSQTDYIFQLRPGGGLGVFVLGYWISTAIGIPVVAPGEWTHVAASFDGTTVQFYRNGEFRGQSAALTGPIPPLPTTEALYLGRQGSACDCNFFQGRMDEVRIWNVARSGLELANQYRRSLIGNEPGLAAYYRFDESGGPALDSSGANRLGTLAGDASRVSSGADIVSGPPRVERFEVTQPLPGEAVFDGSVSAMGWETGAWFIYGPTNGFNAATALELLTPLQTNVSFNTSLLNLSPGVYQVQLQATNAAGSNSSAIRFFTIAPVTNVFGRALILSAGSHVVVSNAPGLSDAMTFEGWIRLPDTNGYYTLLSRGGGNLPSSPTDYILQVQPGGRVAFFAAGGWDDSVFPLVAPNEWTHLAVTFDGVAKRAYRNGVAIGSAPRAGVLQPLGGEPLYLGRQGSVCDCNYLDGALDEARVWNVVRTETEIRDHLNQPLENAPAGLVAYYRFDEAGGTIVEDSSGQNRPGLLVGSAGRVPSGAGLMAQPPRIVRLVVTPTDTNSLVDATILTGGPHTTAWFEWGTNGAFTFSSDLYEAPVGTGLTNLPQFGLVAPSNWVVRLTASNEVGVVTAQTALDGSRPLFELIPVPGLPAVHRSSVAWADYNQDGLLDFLLTGSTANGNIFSQIWRNTGTSFANVPVPGLPQVNWGSVAWADYDRDGRMDFLLTGALVSQIWRNTGSGFTNVPIPGLPGVRFSSVAWGDYDSDGRPDFLIAGQTITGATIAQLWHNTSTGFIHVPITESSYGVERGSVAWADYDNDGRLDFLITGSGLANFWRNNGTGFTYVPTPALRGAGNSSQSWGDFNQDGLLDFLLAGSISGPEVQLWYNSGPGFSQVPISGVFGISYGSVAWGDADQDGRLDFLMAGITYGGSYTRLMRNTDQGFVTLPVPQLTPAGESSVAWGDYNRDGRLDFLLTGSAGGNQLSPLWRNQTPFTNNPPTAPTGLAMTTTPNGVMFSWNAATDAQTPSPGLSYNVRAGTTPGGIDLISPEADVVTGFRRVPAMGNAQMRRFMFLNGVTNGQTIYWSVQAVDTSFAGGPWASQQTAVVGGNLHFTHIERQAGGATLLRLQTPFGATLIQASSNLVHWTPLGSISTNQLPAFFNFLDTNTSMPQRFYRARPE